MPRVGCNCQSQSRTAVRLMGGEGDGVEEKNVPRSSERSSPQCSGSQVYKVAERCPEKLSGTMLSPLLCSLVLFLNTAYGVPLTDAGWYLCRSIASRHMTVILCTLSERSACQAAAYASVGLCIEVRSQPHFSRALSFASQQWARGSRRSGNVPNRAITRFV